MRRCNRTITVLAGLALAATTTRASDEVKTTVPYPEGYRAWRHVKSMLIEPGHPLYAAFGGLRVGVRGIRRWKPVRARRRREREGRVLRLHASQSARDYVFSALRP
jgi:hypothetical protein